MCQQLHQINAFWNGLKIQFYAILSYFRLLRPEVLLAAVLWEDSEAINQAKQLLHNFLNKGQVIPANLKEVRPKFSLQSG